MTRTLRILMMVRRVVSVGLIAVFALLATSPLLACGGWQPTKAARHACCATMGAACPHPEDDADACCARKESTSHSSQATQALADGSVAIVPAFTTLFRAQLAADARALAFPTGTLDAHDHSSLYLRLSLLRV